jgi:sugar phosphate isomerase/epimerase
VPFFPPTRFESADTIARTAELLHAAHENASRRGMRLGYHNHYWEFSSQPDGKPAFESLFDLLHPEIFAEVDVYWARVGGADPAAVLERLGSRARLIHVKDGPADAPESDMTAVGAGDLDIPGTIAAAITAEWHIVELDRCATDMFEAVEASHAYLTGQGLSAGQPR